MHDRVSEEDFGERDGGRSAIEVDPEPADFGLDGQWRIGRQPRDSQDWALETRLRLAQAPAAAGTTPQDSEWATGRRPETEREWQLEYSFRELENVRKNEQAQRQVQYEASVEAARESLRSTSVRSWVLLAIVASIIVMPAVAMATGVAAQSFSEYIAPVTGIAGTVLGYWFSQQDAGRTSRKATDEVGMNTAPAPGFPSLPMT
jgi:hypothetical protein